MFDKMNASSPPQEDTLLLAGKDIRFMNYITDTFVQLLLIWLARLALESLGFDITTDEYMAYFVSFLISFLYYSCWEAIAGVTVGKIFTSTRVVDEYGNKPDFKTTLLRSLCRFIPFNALSFLFLEIGWHDNFSGTRVVMNSKPESTEA